MRRHPSSSSEKEKWMRAASTTWHTSSSHKLLQDTPAACRVWPRTKNRDLEVLTGDAENGGEEGGERLALIFHQLLRQHTIKISDIACRARATLCHKYSPSFCHRSKQLLTLRWEGKLCSQICRSKWFWIEEQPILSMVLGAF